jgi:hypothetical protein
MNRRYFNKCFGFLFAADPTKLFSFRDNSLEYQIVEKLTSFKEWRPTCSSYHLTDNKQIIFDFKLSINSRLRNLNLYSTPFIVPLKENKQQINLAKVNRLMDYTVFNSDKDIIELPSVRDILPDDYVFIILPKTN